jgi:trigger factor
VPGFRPGKVPMGLIKKQYGMGVLADEINKILQKAVYDYIRENKINVLGEPLPDESHKVDFEKDEEFEFLFDIALAPEFEAALGADDKVDYYDIEVTDEAVENQMKMYRQQAGSYEKVESFEDKDMLKGHIAELDEEGNVKEGGIQVEDAVMLPSYMGDEDEKAKFNGTKANDVIVFNPRKAFSNDAEISSLLKLAKKEDAADINGDFSFQINEITRHVEGELTQEIFDRVFGEGTVKTEEEFVAKIRENITSQFAKDSDYKFLLDVKNYLVEKIGKLEFPDESLKRVMLRNNEDKGADFVEENYEKSIEELSWHLIKEKLVAANEIKVEQADVEEIAREATRSQFAQYGMMNVPEEMLNNYAQEMLKKQENVDGLVNRAVETKLAAKLKDVVELNRKSISVADFNKMFE